MMIYFAGKQTNFEAKLGCCVKGGLIGSNSKGYFGPKRKETNGRGKGDLAGRIKRIWRINPKGTDREGSKKESLS